MSDDGGSGVYTYARATWTMALLALVSVSAGIAAIVVGAESAPDRIGVTFLLSGLATTAVLYLDSRRRDDGRLAKVAAGASLFGLFGLQTLGLSPLDPVPLLGVPTAYLMVTLAGAPPYVAYRVASYWRWNQQLKRQLDLARTAIEDGRESMAAGEYDDATDRFETAIEVAREAESEAAPRGRRQDRERPGAKETAQELMSEARSGQTEVSFHRTVDDVEGLLAEADDHAGADEYEPAKERYSEAAARADIRRTQREGFEDVTERLDELHERAQRRHDEVVEALEAAEYEDAVETAETAAKRGDESMEADEHAEAVEAYETAIDAAESAVRVAEDGPGDPEGLRERIREYDRRRAEGVLAALSDRLDAVPTDPDDYGDALGHVESIAADAAEADVDQRRERDLIVADAVEHGFDLATEAAGDAVEEGTEAFEREEYERAREAFDRGAGLVDRARRLGEDHGVDADERLDDLAETCEYNADAARRAKLGLGEEPPSVERIDGSATGPAGGSDSGTTAGSSRPVVTQSTSAGEAFAEYPVPREVPAVPDLDLESDDLDIGERIGTGGNADVFRATVDTADGPLELAVKQPRFQGTVDVSEVETFLEEAETWAGIDDHRGIVGVVDWGSDATPWIAMEYMDRGTLADLGDDMDLPQRLWTAHEITEAVHHAHRRGIQHFDLKPENVLFRSTGGWPVPKVTDWGLARHLLEHSGTVDGFSPTYAAPEQLDPETYGGTNERTDVYALGAALYELFTGRPPFEGPQAAVIRSHLDEDPTPPSDVADVPEALDEPLLGALRKEPEKRYESVLYLRDGLLSVAEGVV